MSSHPLYSISNRDDDDFPLELTPLIKTNIILSFFSLIGSLTIIFLFIFRKKLRSFVFNLVLFLSISETLNSIGNIMSIHKFYPENKTISLICSIQAVIINYTDFCSLTWMSIISYTIYDLMINFNQDFSRKKIVFLIIGFGLPFIFIIIQAIPFYFSVSHIKSQNKESQCWCWIYDMEDNWVTVLVIYIVYWIFIIGNFLVIWKVIRVLKSCVDESDKFCKRIKKMVNKLYMYPLVSAFCFVFATIHRMYQIFYIFNPNKNPGKEAYRLEIILYLLHGMLISFRGFIYFLLFGSDKKVICEIKYLLSRIYRCVFRKEPSWFSLKNYEEGEVLLQQDLGK